MIQWQFSAIQGHVEQILLFFSGSLPERSLKVKYAMKLKKREG